LLFETTVKLGEKGQKERQYSTALRYFEEAAKLRPHAPEPHRGMAEVYTREGKPSQAAEEQKEANRLSGK
jgi:Tfp pilus assembly protein PilF